MKSFFVTTTALVLAVSQVTAFSTTSSFSGSQVTRASVQNNNGLTMEYIPSGISKAQWAKMKEDEKNKKNGKNLGQSGITTFKSRSFSDWQKAGGVNLFPGKHSNHQHITRYIANLYIYPVFCLDSPPCRTNRSIRQRLSVIVPNDHILSSQTIFIYFSNNNPCSLYLSFLHSLLSFFKFHLPVNPKGLDPKDIPYMQRPGGMADNSDLIGKKKTGGAFSFGGKKKAPAAAPVAPPMKAGSFSFGGKKAPAPVPVAAKKAGKFSFGGKKKAPEPEPEAPKKKNFFGL